MFDSPFEYCPLRRAYVLLDQTQRQCAREYCCAVLECPLVTLFTGVDFRNGEGKAGKVKIRGTVPRSKSKRTA